ncbi:MAG TPA: ROK family protein [Lichenihabitans sp.]|nr:ROK family protein [Lichenihabitans sp.]
MASPRTLSIDIGGTGLKCSVLDEAGEMLHDKVWRPSPTEGSPQEMIADIKEMTRELPAFDRISAGFSGAVRGGRIITAPHFAEPSWPGYDLAQGLADAFGKPARVLNDAEVQGFGVISGKGLEFVLTLGTGAGTALFRDGQLAPHMEFAHHPVHGKKTYNEYVGRDALGKVGKKRWNKRVRKVIGILDALVHYDRLYIGGGNGEKVHEPLPDNVTLVSNTAGITGGIALWRDGTASRGGRRRPLAPPPQRPDGKMSEAPAAQ